MGHIELPVPVYNPLLFADMYRLLRSMCLKCFYFRVEERKVCPYQ